MTRTPKPITTVLLGMLLLTGMTRAQAVLIDWNHKPEDAVASPSPTDGKHWNLLHGGTSGSGATPPEVILGADGGFALSTAVRNNQSLAGDPDYIVDYNYGAGSGKLLSQHVMASAGGDYIASVGNANSMSITAFGWAAVSPSGGSIIYVR